MLRANAFKRRLARGEPVLGMWVQSGSPVAAEVAARAGFDVVLIDLEHGHGELDRLVHMIRAVQTTEATAMVRVPGKDPFTICRVLDAGAEAVLIPLVRDAREAERVAAFCRYPPRGVRGYAWPVIRASGYGLYPDRFARANEEILVAVQIETAQAAAEAAAIAAIDEVDLVFVGPMDLAGSLGHPGDPSHPEVLEVIRTVEEAVLDAGKPLGTIPRPDADAAALFARGYRYVVAASDVVLLAQGARGIVEALRPARRGDGHG